MRYLRRATHWWGLIEWACLLLITPFLLFATPTRAPLLLVIPVLWVLRRLLLGQFVPRTPVDVIVLVLMVMGGVAFCVSPDPAWSQLKIEALLLGVGFLYATVDLLEPAGRLRWVPAGVIAISIGFLGLGLLGTRWGLKIPQLTALMARLPGEMMYPLFQAPPGAIVPHAHNEFLQGALDLGLPGLVAWLALYMVTFWMLCQVYWHSADSLIRALALGNGGALIAHLAYAMTDCGVLDAKPNIVFWSVVGLSVTLCQSALLNLTFCNPRLQSQSVRAIEKSER